MLNFIETEDLKEIMRGEPTTERERALMDALSEAEHTRERITALFYDYPETKDIRPDLERVRDTLKELKDSTEKEAEAWFNDNEPTPRLDGGTIEERHAAVCFKLSGLFDSGFMDHDDLDALTLAGNVYEIAEKAWKEI